MNRLFTILALCLLSISTLWGLEWVKGKSARIISPVVSILEMRLPGSPIVQQTFKGEVFEIVQKGETWARVKTPKGEGWLLLKDVEIVDTGAMNYGWLIPLSLIILGFTAFIVYRLNQVRQARLAEQPNESQPEADTIL